MNMIRVYHAVNTSGLNRKNGESWIDYWKQTTKKPIPKICPCCGNETSQEDFVGAHVKKYSEYANSNQECYITPTCDSCNKKYKDKVCLSQKHLFSVAEDSLVEAKEE